MFEILERVSFVYFVVLQKGRSFKTKERKHKQHSIMPSSLHDVLPYVDEPVSSKYLAKAQRAVWLSMRRSETLEPTQSTSSSTTARDALNEWTAYQQQHLGKIDTTTAHSPSSTYEGLLSEYHYWFLYQEAISNAEQKLVPSLNELRAREERGEAAVAQRLLLQAAGTEFQTTKTNALRKKKQISVKVLEEEVKALRKSVRQLQTYSRKKSVNSLLEKFV